MIAKLTTPYKYGTMLFIGIITALSGELKLTPFDEMSLRFGFGSIVFFIAVLMLRVPIMYTGIVTGIIVWLFRTFLDTVQFGTLHLTENLPAMVFYAVFAIGLAVCDVYRWRSHPLILGFIGAGLELVANFIELALHIYLLNELLRTPKEYIILLLAAMIRSFFVVGIYSTIVVNEQKKRTEQLLAIHSNLYVEALYIEKMMQNIEEVTSKSFALYRTLQTKAEPSNVEALQIAQSIHEIKKDAQRINAGLSKIVQDDSMEQYEMHELLEFVSKANKQYAQKLEKNISIVIQQSDNMKVKEHFLLLALMNNIVANAIEAIPTEGTVMLDARKTGELLKLTIQNNGPRIDETMIDVIFDPGFTTKFGEYGHASTGIGLSHVKAIVEQLNGSIRVESDELTTFIVTIPIEHL